MKLADETTRPRTRRATMRYVAAAACIASGLMTAALAESGQSARAASKPLVEEGPLTVRVEEGGTTEDPRGKWHLQVANRDTGSTRDVPVADSWSNSPSFIEHVALDRGSDRLSLLFRQSVMVVDLKAGRHLLTFPAYVPTASPGGRFIAFDEHYPASSPAPREVRRWLDVRAIPVQGVPQLLEPDRAGRVLFPETSTPAEATRWSSRSPYFWLDDDTLAFTAYDSVRDVSQVLVFRHLDGQPSRSTVDVDAVPLVREPGAASAASLLKVGGIRRLSENPLRLRLTFREDYKLNARTLDVAVAP